MRIRPIVLAAAALLASGIATTAAAQPPNLSGFWAPKPERAPSNRALIDALPDEAVIISDTGGGELGAGQFGGLRLSERAIEEVGNYDPADELRSENTCVPPSVAFYMQAPFPMEVYHGADMIVFKMEYFDLYRVIFLDGRSPPPADAPHSKSGYSVGHWEGDTLVVETTHIAPGTFMNNGFDHSDDIKMTERFALGADGTTLSLVQLYQDPDTFDGLAARYMAFTRTPGEYVYPYDCDPSYGR